MKQLRSNMLMVLMFVIGAMIGIVLGALIMRQVGAIP